MDATYILTGYNTLALSLVDSQSPGTSSNFADLLNKYIDRQRGGYGGVGELAPAPLCSGSSRTQIGTEELHRSSLFSRLPWLTTIEDAFVSPPTLIQCTAAALQKDFVLSLQATDENSRAYRGALSGEMPAASTASHTFVASRLLIARLLDICCSLEETYAKGNGDVAPPPLTPSSSLKSFSLPDWTETMRAAENFLRSPNVNANIHSDGGCLNSTNLSADQLQSRQLFIFSACNERMSNSSRIYANGRLDNPGGPKEAAEEFGEGLEEPMSGWTSLSRPLELAIAAGPTILFSTKKLSVNRTSRARLTQLWIQRGKVRNHSVWSVEKEIWKGLLEIAQGTPVEHGVLGILARTQNLLSPVSQAARLWYHVEDNTLDKSGDVDFLEFLHAFPASMPATLPAATPVSVFTHPRPALSHEVISFENRPWSMLTVDPALVTLRPQNVPPQTPPPTPCPPAPPSLPSWVNSNQGAVMPSQSRMTHRPVSPSFKVDVGMAGLATDQPVGHRESQAVAVEIAAAKQATQSPTKILGYFPLQAQDFEMGDDLSWGAARASQTPDNGVPMDEDHESTLHSALQPLQAEIMGDCLHWEVSGASPIPASGMPMDEDCHGTPFSALQPPQTESMGDCLPWEASGGSQMPAIGGPSRPRSTPPSPMQVPIPHREKRRHRSSRTPKAPPFRGHHPEKSRSKKGAEAKPPKNSPPSDPTTFGDMKNVAIRDITEEYHRPVFRITGLDTNSHPPKIQGERMAVFKNPGGEGSYEWVPRFHFQRDLDIFYRLYDTSEKSGIHPNLTHLTHDEYKDLDTHALLRILKKSHLVVSGHPRTEERRFDRAGLVRLGALTKTIGINGQCTDAYLNNPADLPSAQDHSIESCSDSPGDNGLQRSGTLCQILSQAYHPDGKALSSLEFPRSAPPEIDLRFSTDSVAWDQVQGEEWCTDSYPATAVRWGVCATNGAYQKVHFDCEGFGTFVYPESGVSIWMVGVPRHGETFDELADAHPFLSEAFGMDGDNSHFIDWVAFPLKPGSVLVMRPNTLHAVFTAENTVCMGGRYFSTPTLRDTCYGIYHSFLAGGCLAGNGHVREAFTLLARVVAFYKTSLMGPDLAGPEEMVNDDFAPDDPRRHLPDLTSFDGLLDLCSLFSLLELGNALSPWSYGEGESIERRRLMYARKRARILRRWVFGRYELLDSSNNVVDYKRAFYWPYLVQQAKALVLHKGRAEAQAVGGCGLGGGCTAAAVLKIIEESLQHEEELWNMYRDSEETPSSFAWRGPQLHVGKVESPLLNDEPNDEQGFNLDDIRAFESAS